MPERGPARTEPRTGGRRISDEQKLEVKRLSDIVEVIGEYLPLKRAGTNWKALCPFHEEKTASFNVSPTRQTFRCFGCGAGGDVFEFVMRHEKVEFPEALKILAERSGVKLRFDASSGPGEEEKGDLYRLCEWAATFFQEQLGEHAGAEARRYVEKRGIAPAMVAEFRLGYAPDAWSRLLDAAKKAGFSEALQKKAGLAIPRESGGFYDRFRDRLIFPIQDARGRVIAFGGRALDDSEPKYLNSPETPLFQKGRNLYALPQARDAALKEGRLAIVEGYTDAIMAHQHGVRWFAATLGTALTRDHISLIRRYAAEALAVFDGDEAGKKASERSLDMFLSEDMPMRIASMPAGLDPCDCLIQKGKDVFVQCLGEAKELFEYRLALARERHDISTMDGKAAAIDEVLASVAVTASQVKREMALRRLAEEFQVKESALSERLASRGVKGRVVEGVRTGEAAKKNPDKWERAAREVIESLLLLPVLIERARQDLDIEDIHSEHWKGLFQQVLHAEAKVPGKGLSELFAVMEDSAAKQELVTIADDAGRKKTDLKKQYDGAIAFYAKMRMERPAGRSRAHTVDQLKESYEQTQKKHVGRKTGDGNERTGRA